MKKFAGEFKAFVLKGNVMNLAVGVIIGAAFQGVVASLSENILSPIIGLFTGNNLDALEVSMLGATLRYGAFITSVINFFIMALVVFIIVKALNRLTAARSREEQPAARKCPYCQTEISPDAVRCPACTSDIAAAGDS